MKESYGGGNGSRYLSKREIENMKKNMKKVPIIQKKSEQYHEKDNKNAEIFIEDSLGELGESKQIRMDNKLNESKESENLGKIIIKWIKKLFKNIK